jgi:hypothetical protein
MTKTFILTIDTNRTRMRGARDEVTSRLADLRDSGYIDSFSLDEAPAESSPVPDPADEAKQPRPNTYERIARQIHARLDGREWDGADTLDEIADIFVANGLTIRGPIEDES